MCTFSAKGGAARAVSGLPVTVPCSSGTATADVSVAENRAKHPRSYTVALSATGSGATVTTTAVITVSAVTTPPTVSDFSSSPSPVASTGGQATLSADVSNAIDCTFSSRSASVSGLPVTVPCSVGTVSANVTVPANRRTRTVSYKVKLVVHGHRRRTKANTVIIVARPTGAG
jgi:PKD repeat protein